MQITSAFASSGFCSLAPFMSAEAYQLASHLCCSPTTPISRLSIYLGRLTLCLLIIHSSARTLFESRFCLVQNKTWQSQLERSRGEAADGARRQLMTLYIAKQTAERNILWWVSHHLLFVVSRLGFKGRSSFHTRWSPISKARLARLIQMVSCVVSLV